MITKQDINDFAARCQDMANRTAPLTFTVDFGRKFARIVRHDAGLSVYCFVDMTNGDVRKAASWKTPAKHARGNINDDSQGMSAMTPYGAVYMR